MRGAMMLLSMLSLASADDEFEADNYAGCISMNFDESYDGSENLCPVGWICNGHHPGKSDWTPHVEQRWVGDRDGPYFFEIGGDSSTGQAQSAYFRMPPNTYKVLFKGCGGADQNGVNGMTIWDVTSGDAICHTWDGYNTDNMMELSCLVQGSAGKLVQIEFIDNQNSGWGKVWVDDIRFVDEYTHSVLNPNECLVGASGDPHLALPHGARADFRGEDKAIYNFLSAKGLSLNVMTELADFELHKPDHPHHKEIHGSFLTQAHVVARTENGKTVHVSVWANKIGPTNRIFVNGTVDHEPEFKFGIHTKKVIDNIVLSTDYSTLTVFSPEFEILITPRFFRLERNVFGLHHRLDVQTKLRVKEEALKVHPHGIIGQSWDGDDMAIDGEVDKFPESGEFTTYAMAKGAIEGTPMDYKMPSAYATNFKYSRFDATEAPIRDVSALVAAGELNKPHNAVMTATDGFVGATEEHNQTAIYIKPRIVEV